MKDYRISSIRMMATIMVVALHVCQYLEKYYWYLRIVREWLNLGLVMFFTMSAFLYANRTIDRPRMGGWIAHRYKEVAIPALLTTLITLLVYGIGIGEINVRHVWWSIASGLGFEAFLSYGWMFYQMWFLTYILFCYCTIPIVQYIPVKKMSTTAFWGMLIGATAILQGLVFVAGKLTNIPILSWGQLLRFYLPYFLFRRYAITSRELKKTMCWMTALSGVCIAGVACIRYGMTLNDRFVPLVELAFIYTQTMAGTALFYWLYRFFSKIEINHNLLRLSDRYSYPVYLTHCLFIGYKTSIIDRMPNLFLGVAAALICTAVGSVMLDFLVKRINRMITVRQ